MAFILKRPVGQSKGVAMFTHKERALLHLSAPLIGPALRRLRERYVVGMHWGFYAVDVPVMSAVDFHLAKPSTVQFRSPSEVRALPFNSSMFTPEYFRQEPRAKHWDILSVTRSAKFKNTDQLLDALRIVYDERPETHTLVICTASPVPDPVREDLGIWQKYEASFDELERERFKLVMTSGALFPFSRRDVAFFYQSSRVFTLFTETEGVAKVVNEALLCGLPVVIQSAFKGGGADYLTPQNSRRFSSVAEGADALLQLLQGEPVRFDTQALAAEVSETHSIGRFERALAELFRELGLPYEGELDTADLSRKLPAHRPGMLPSSLRVGSTWDVLTPRAMLAYLRSVLDGAPLEASAVSASEQRQLQLWSAYLISQRHLQRVRSRAQRLTRRLTGAR
jgi:glycosyltransferase involved in cell wall biosynthesis